MGLDRVRDVLGRLGLVPPAGRVITVGGTNGKGSTITLLHDLLHAAGRNPGLYTSPHLVHYHERIRIGNRPVGDLNLIRAFERVEAAREAVSLTYFEFGTLAAFTCFAEAGCDTWLLEVGLGGRLDAVNVLDADIAVITTIGLDHQEWLGNTIEAIAAEKAGILRHAKPALYGDEPVPAAIRARAAALGTALQVAGTDFGYQRHAGAGGWRWFQGARVIDSLAAPRHWTGAQFRNASLALATFAALDASQLPTAEILKSVIERSTPPGRFHVVQREHRWVLDVAHNPQAASVLREQIRADASSGLAGGGVTVVTALLADKAITEFVAELGPIAAQWIITAVDDPRASSEAEMRRGMLEAGIESVAWEPVPAAAFERARRTTPPGGWIVVCGSFRIVAPALRWLGLY